MTTDNNDNPSPFSVKARRLDPGAGYLHGRRDGYEDAMLAFDVAGRFYGDRLGEVVVRAMKVPNNAGGRVRGEREVQSIFDAFALLHRIVDETDATVEDLRDAGLSDRIVAAVDAATPRDGETAEQTAMRAAANADLITMIFDFQSGLKVGGKSPDKGWWMTEPAAREILANEDDRLKTLEKEQRAQTEYDYSLPTTKLREAGVPVAWANRAKHAWQSFTDKDYNRYRDRDLPRISYDHTRVTRIDATQHLLDVYAAGMTAEDYEAYVQRTQLTWKQIPAWYEAGLGPAAARLLDSAYDRKADAAKLAVELTGSPERAWQLFRWLTDLVERTPREQREETIEPVMRKLNWSFWSSRSDPRHLGTKTRVKAAWEFMVGHVGGEEAARRLLDLRDLLPVQDVVREFERSPREIKRGQTEPYQRTVKDQDGYPAFVQAWNDTGLAVERIGLLIAAGVTDPATATDEQHTAMSDDQLRMWAQMATAK